MSKLNDFSCWLDEEQKKVKEFTPPKFRYVLHGWLCNRVEKTTEVMFWIETFIGDTPMLSCGIKGEGLKAEFEKYFNSPFKKFDVTLVDENLPDRLEWKTWKEIGDEFSGIYSFWNMNFQRPIEEILDKITSRQAWEASCEFTSEINAPKPPKSIWEPEHTEWWKSLVKPHVREAYEAPIRRNKLRETALSDIRIAWQIFKAEKGNNPFTLTTEKP